MVKSILPFTEESRFISSGIWFGFLCLTRLEIPKLDQSEYFDVIDRQGKILFGNVMISVRVA